MSMARLVSIMIIIAIVVVAIFGLSLITGSDKTTTDPIQPIKPGAIDPIENEPHQPPEPKPDSEPIEPLETYPIEPIEYADPPAHWLETKYDGNTKKVYLIYDGELLDTQIDATGAYSDTYSKIGRRSNADGSVHLIQIGDHPYTVYSVYKGTVSRISDSAGNYWLSRDGEIVYLEQEGTLYSYNLQLNERSRIRSVNLIYDFEVSTDGRHALFTGANTMYYYHGGEVVEIGTDYKARAVTNLGGIYYYDVEEEGLFYMAGPKGEKTKLASGREMNVLVRNYDNTQFIFDARDEGAKLYFVSEGDLSARFIGVVTAKRENNDNSGASATPASPTWVPMEQVVPRELRMSAYAIKDLRGMLYYASGDVWHLKDDLEHELFIAEPARACMLAMDGNTMLYVNSHTLFLFRLDQGGRHTEIAGNVDYSNYRITGDGQTIYFTNRENVLFCLHGDDKPVKIADSVRYYQISSKDNTLYFMTGGALYSYNDLREFEKIADNVDRFSVHYDHVVYLTGIGRGSDNIYDVYLGSVGEGFTRILEGIQYAHGT